MLAIVLLLTCQLPFSLDNVGTIVATLLFSTPLTLLIIGIVQVCRRVMPSSLVAASAIMPTVILNDLHQIHHRAPDFRRIAIILTPGTRIIVLSFIFICLWGRLPHRTHAPHSAVAVSSLGVASIWQAIIALLSAWNKNNMHAVDASTGFIQIQPMVHAFPSLLTHLHEDKSSLALAMGAASWISAALGVSCGVALLAFLLHHKNIIVTQCLSITLCTCALVDAIINGFMAIYHPLVQTNLLTTIILLLLMTIAPLALAVPVFSRSFRQWCDGTWTPPPARAAGAVAGRPTILARTFQPVGPDGRPLDQTAVAALLPTTRLTFWISFFFGLFGLIPMLTANSTAKNLGVVTNAYNHAMIKGLLIGIATWTAVTIAFYALIFAILAGL